MLPFIRVLGFGLRRLFVILPFAVSTAAALISHARIVRLDARFARFVDTVALLQLVADFLLLFVRKQRLIRSRLMQQLILLQSCIPVAVNSHL
ncbi:MAG: hypothetical protein K0R75_3221 [Paenibacillaceae bacterium]|nr:hypothetical protein [Paenibacillaceae bacterium]